VSSGDMRLVDYRRAISLLHYKREGDMCGRMTQNIGALAIGPVGAWVRGMLPIGLMMPPICVID
jgi:hypothetical protein